ncbi:MAG: hypothetical protein AAF802_03205, partial [Planctomycetota bacterium]
GVFLIGCAFYMVFKNCFYQIRMQRLLPLIEIQAFTFSLVMANLGSFVASHQHFSGDPANALWALLFAGVFIGTLSLEPQTT